MNKYLLSFLLLASLSFKASAQQNFFIYIESEVREPFYVLINGKINYSSSINGFLTIPQMQNGVYDAEIGFVRGKYPEQHFIISIKSQDLGYVLRKTKDNTFGLLNLQTFETINPVTITNGTIPQQLTADTTTKPLSSFTDKLKQAPKCIIATDDDFNTLHRQMIGETTEEGMIATAEATFAQKCFSTEEVKKLSGLLRTEKGKLTFFLAARKSVYDQNNYSALENQLTDPAIVKQFRNTL